MTQEAPAWPASCWRSARRAVAAAVVAGQVAAATTGVLPWPVMLLTSTLVVLALHLDELAVHAVSVVRTSAQLAAALAGVVGLLAAARAPDPTSAMSRMVILLAVLQVAAGAAARTRRDLHGVNVMAGCVVVGSAATLSDIARGLPAVAAWPVILVAASVVQRLAAYDSVQAVAQRSAHHGTGSPRRSPVAAAAVAALLVGLAGFLVLPGANAASLRNRLSAGHGTTSAAGVGRATAGIDTTGTGRLDMSLRGKLPDAPVAVVSSASPKLWRGTTYDTYTGRGWFNSNPAIAPLPASSADLKGTRRDSLVVVAPSDPQVVWAPGQVVGFTPHTGLVVQDAFGDVRAMHLASATYTVATRAPATPEQLARASGADLSDQLWLQLPASLPTRDVRLAQRIVAGARTRADAVTAVERWLGANARYSLDSPVPAPDRDAVDAFLFDDHVGFCEQFASAEVVLLRSVGIPSRLVTGLAYGAPAATPGLRTFRASDAHAWVEVWYPGLGWQPSDPTAHAALAKQGAGTDGRIRAMLRRLVGDSQSRHVVLAVLLVVIAVAVAAIALTGRRRREGPAGERTDWRPSPGPVAMAFGVFSNRWRATVPRAPSETAREYVARVATTDPLDDALVTLEEECYGAQVPDTRRVVAAVDAFEGSRPPVTDVGPQSR